MFEPMNREPHCFAAPPNMDLPTVPYFGKVPESLLLSAVSEGGLAPPEDEKVSAIVSGRVDLRLAA